MGARKPEESLYNIEKAENSFFNSFKDNLFFILVKRKAELEVAWDSEGPKAKISYLGLREASKVVRPIEKAKAVTSPDRRAAALKAWATIRARRA